MWERLSGVSFGTAFECMSDCTSRGASGRWMWFDHSRSADSCRNLWSSSNTVPFSCVLICCKHAMYQRQNQLQSHITPVWFLANGARQIKVITALQMINPEGQSFSGMFMRSLVLLLPWERKGFDYACAAARLLFFPLLAVCPEYEMMQWGSHN